MQTSEGVCFFGWKEAKRCKTLNQTREGCWNTPLENNAMHDLRLARILFEPIAAVFFGSLRLVGSLQRHATRAWGLLLIFP